jgi:division protein CdvB (Snf7/Vps24/ESCRT-III family)
MNFIKIKNQDGRTVILNVSQITSIWQSGEKTFVLMQHPEDVVTVNEPIDVFAKYLADDDKIRLDVVGS